MLLPTAGEVTVDGINIAQDPHEVRRRIGFLPDTPPLYNEMTVGRYLEFAAQLRGVPAGDVEARVAEAEEKTSIRDKHDHLISSLSHGYRQRVGVAQAMVHKPQLRVQLPAARSWTQLRSPVEPRSVPVPPLEPQPAINKEARRSARAMPRG